MMQLSPRARRNWIVGIVIFFVVLIGSIAFAQWWAVTKNVPNCERKIHAGQRC